MRISELRTTKARAAIGEFTYEACASCVHGGNFFEQGCERKIILADVELGVVYCEAFKEKPKPWRWRRKKKWNRFTPASIEQEGYE
jgi:hypothetical protein